MFTPRLPPKIIRGTNPHKTSPISQSCFEQSVTQQKPYQHSSSTNNNIMCKYSYTLCEYFHHSRKCECQYFVDEPQYCETVEKSFTKKGFLGKTPAGRPAWAPTLCVSSTTLGNSLGGSDGLFFELSAREGPILFIHKEHFRPVQCEQIKYVKQGSTNTCPLHSSMWRISKISEQILAYNAKKRDEEKKREEEKKAGGKMRKAMKIADGIIFAA